jgi:hypothetical protein
MTEEGEMNANDRELLNAKFGELLHIALVVIRNATYPPIPGDQDRRAELNDLADLLHNIPRYIIGHDEHAIDSFEQFRGAVVEHVRRFYPDIDPNRHRYVQLLDLDAETFANHYKHHNWSVPTTAAS